MKTFPSWLVVSLGFLTTLSALGADENKLDLNAVSILFPAPTRETLTVYPSAKDQTLLPEKIFEQAKLSAVSEAESDAEVSRLTLIGLRIDPCFRETFVQSCMHQIRAVWQVPYFEGSKTNFKDGALHTFYKLNDAEWDSFLSKWKNLWKPYEKDLRKKALQVNPILSRNGLNQPFFAQMKTTVLPYIRADNLMRMAVSLVYFKPLDQIERGWKFSIFDVIDGNVEVKSIPTMSVGLRHLAFDNYGNDREFDAKGTINRLGDTPATDRIHRYVFDSQEPRHFSRDESVALFRSMTRLQNPSFHAPGTTDCISCHVAASARSILAGQLTPETKRAGQSGNIYQNPRYNLKSVTPIVNASKDVRMFGYFRGVPSINPRVIFESAEVADALNAN
jgi:hypothetical protein